MLSDIEGLEVPTQRDYVGATWHLYPLRVPAKLRRAVFEQLRAAGVGVQVNYLPAYWHPVLADLGYPQGICPVAEDFYATEISLPLYSTLDDTKVKFVADAVSEAVANR